jgi:hypothetical protein
VQGVQDEAIDVDTSGSYPPLFLVLVNAFVFHFLDNISVLHIVDVIALIPTLMKHFSDLAISVPSFA